MQEIHSHTTSHRSPTTDRPRPATTDRPRPATTRAGPATARGTVAAVIALLAVFWAAIHPLAALTILVGLLAVATAALAFRSLVGRAALGRRIRRAGLAVPMD